MIVGAFVGVALALAGFLVGCAVTRAESRRGDIPTGEEHRHHQALARWVDHVLVDDTIRPLLPAHMREDGQALLDAYYGR